MVEKSRLSVAVSVVSLLTAAIVAGINLKVLPAGAFWVCAAGFVALIVAASWAPVRSLFDAYMARNRCARVAARYRPRLIALAAVVNELTSQSDVRSVGSILNPPHTQKLVDAHGVNAYLGHLSSLSGWNASILRRAQAGEISGSLLAYELHCVIREYVRLCDSVATKFEFQETTSQTKADVQDRCWSEIARRANAVVDELLDLCRVINLDDPRARLGTYLSSVRSLNLRVRFEA